MPGRTILTETLRLELSPQNIVLKLIEPGFVPATRLVEKAQANAPVLTIVIPEYEAYVTRRMAFFNSEFTVELATPEDVAEALLASVNEKPASCAGSSVPTRRSGCI